MEKLPFFIHGKPITDQATNGNVGVKQRLLPNALIEWFSHARILREVRIACLHRGTRETNAKEA